MPNQPKYVPPTLRRIPFYKPVSLTMKRPELTKEQMYEKMRKDKNGKADEAWYED